MMGLGIREKEKGLGIGRLGIGEWGLGIREKGVGILIGYGR
jgi:hypothetical protein